MALTAFAAAPGYQLKNQIKLGGEGFWDYTSIDSAARRLYVSHGAKVIVVNVDTEKTEGEITGLKGVHGIAIAPDLNRGFISSGGDNEAVIFDLKTLAVLDRVKTGANPDAILYDPATKQVFTFNGRGKDATVIDAVTGKVAGTIALGSKPEFAAADGKGNVYVNLEDLSKVSVIDAKTRTVTHTYPLAPCEEPSGMAMDTAKGRLFIGCSNKMMAIVDTASGKVLATPPIGDGVDANSFDPGTGLAFSSNGEGTVTVVGETSPGKFEVVETVKTRRGARTMTVDTKTHRLYLPSAEFGPAPVATAANPHPRPAMLPGSFVILVVGK